MIGTQGDLEKLAYEAALRGLDKQERLLEELRARTGVLLAAASIAAPFLGAKALQDSNPRGFTFTALAAFVTAVGASVFVLLPRKDFAFAEAGAGQYERLFPIRADLPEVYRQLVYAMDDLWTSNDQRIAGMIQACSIAAVALMVEIVCPVVLLAATLF